MFSAHIFIGTPVELSSISSQLEHLPLSLAQAAAFIQETSTTVANYLQLLCESDKNVVRLFISEPLFFMSLLDRQCIPTQFLSYYIKQRENKEPLSDWELTEALGALKAYSLVTEDNYGDYDMHRLIQLLTSNSTYNRFRKEALMMVLNLYPYGTYKTQATCAAYLSHANAVGDEAEAKASLLHCVAAYPRFEGQWDDAEPLDIKEMAIRKGLLGEEHPSTLTSMANLASTLWNQGWWEEAEKLEVQVMETRKMKLGADHPDTVTSMNNLAYTWNSMDKKTVAIDLMQLCIHLREIKLGVDHPHTRSVLALDSWQK
ncbi:unnamed protein product [Clonostachys chloroleuca]|uniref:Kinesin light chain n=1 Tax=Clonostachys chloroleuca TaxID=1926264 RepID=A0AA35M4V3_9HYPO|nr:unnamed protein product [Clonostachys chloroleuca]